MPTAPSFFGNNNIYGSSQNANYRQLLAPITNATSRVKSALFSPPQSYIDTIRDGMWPNPLQPVLPFAPTAEPISWPLQWGSNLIFTPRYDAEYTAAQLRNLARYPLARICIENNKDILTRMPWKIQLKPLPGETNKKRIERGKGDPQLKKLNDFFARPNPDQDWSSFLRPVIEDMLVIDAGCIFIGRNKKGDVLELRWIDGASITRLVDEHGWTPRPPNPAYQQLWEGYPRTDLTTQQLLYRPRNIAPRGSYSSFFYGFSPTEQVAEEIKIGIERLNYTLDFYTEGSIPNAMLFAPIDTPPDKIAEAQKIIDAALAGQLGKRRRLQIMQGFQQEGKTEQLHTPKEPQMADTFDDLHIRKIAFAYGTSPHRLQRQMNRASAEQAQESADEEGTLPFLGWLKDIINEIVQVQMGSPDYECSFDPFVETNKLKLAQADEINVKYAMYSINEIREQHGDDPREEAEADKIGTMTPYGFVPIDQQANLPTRFTGGGGPQGKANGHAIFKTNCSQHFQHSAGCPDCDAAMKVSSFFNNFTK